MPNYVPRDFTLTMNGFEMALTEKGIYTPKLGIRADSNNLQPVYVGNIYDNGREGNILTLGNANNLRILQPGQGEEYTDDKQYDRFPRMRSPFIERGYLHIMSEWFVKGTAGDLVFVSWLDENTGSFKDVYTQLPIDVTSTGLSR